MAHAATQNGKGATNPEFQSSATPDAQDLHGQIKTLRADVEKLTSMLRENAEDKVRNARSQAQDHADHAKSEVQRQAKYLADTAAAYHSDAEAAVKANPGTALGIATGLGFLAGMLLSRR